MRSERPGCFCKECWSDHLELHTRIARNPILKKRNSTPLNHALTYRPFLLAPSNIISMQLLLHPRIAYRISSLSRRLSKNTRTEAAANARAASTLRPLPAAGSPLETPLTRRDHHCVQTKPSRLTRPSILNFIVRPSTSFMRVHHQPDLVRSHTPPTHTDQRMVASTLTTYIVFERFAITSWVGGDQSFVRPDWNTR